MTDSVGCCECQSTPPGHTEREQHTLKVSIEGADLEAVIILDTPAVVRIRSDEEWARRCISVALGGVDVVHHDDGSEPGMHDLEISYVDHPSGAVEVTAAADAESIELWNLVNSGGRWKVPGLAGGWIVEVSPRARARRLKADLPTLLKQLEQAVYQEAGYDRWRPGLFDYAVAALVITRLSKGGIPGTATLRLNSFQRDLEAS